MATLVYSPAIQILIGSRKHGILDVSEDCSRGQVTLSENAVHSLSFDLLNQNRKYDQVFTPNDRVVLRMKRLKMLPVFAGYLNAVPFFSAYPQTVRITASCTLKRLQYTFWDPGTAQSAALLNIKGTTQIVNPVTGIVEQEDGLIRDKVQELLVQVAKWETANIHIGAVPLRWFDNVARLMDQVSDRINFQATSVGTSATVAGSNAVQDGSTNIPGAGPGTGQLRDTSGIATYYHTAGKSDAGSGPGSLGNKNELGFWYCAISGPWANRDGSSYLTNEQARVSRDWWKGRRLLVTCTTTNQSIVVAVADFEAASGQAGSENHVIDLDTYAFENGLGIPLSRGGAPVEIRFAPDSDPKTGTPLGTYRGPTPASSPTPVSGAPHIDSNANKKGGPGVGTAGGIKVDDFLALALAQKGKQYTQGSGRTWGADVANPPSFDCSGLVHWLLLRLGVPGAGGYDVSDTQYNISKSRGLDIPIDQAIKTKGALLFRNGKNAGGGSSKVAGEHVAISLGNGHTIGASSPTTGVRIGEAKNKQQDPQWGYDVAALAIGVDYTGATDGSLPNAADPTDPGALITNPNVALPEDVSAWFGGARALINDEPLWGTVKDLMNASMRSFCSAPNGDFIGWFPDYFGLYGSAATMIIRDIELRQEFSVYWDDSRLITHEFTAGAPAGGTGNRGIPGGQVTNDAMALTAGIASVDFPEIIAALFNIDPGDDTVFKDRDTILSRFGARPNFDAMPTITLREAEFWSAIRLFQKNWAEQFSATIPLTFMPEIFPGMLLKIESMKLQVYVEEVTHSWDFSEGGGFTTTCRTIAPAATDKGGLKGLLVSGAAKVVPTVPLNGGLANTESAPTKRS